MWESMKRALNILIYTTNAISAITKGCKVIWENWPSGNVPFTGGHSSPDHVPIRQQQSELDKSDDDKIEPLEEPERVSDSTS